MLTPELIFSFGVLAVVASAIVHIAFAVGVFFDSVRLQEEGKDCQIVPGPMWAFATLIGGVFVAGAYWLIHRSSFFSRHL